MSFLPRRTKVHYLGDICPLCVEEVRGKLSLKPLLISEIEGGCDVQT